MDFLKKFRKKVAPTVEERVKEWRKQIQKEVRMFEKQIMGIKKEETKTHAIMKQSAKKNQMDSCKILAREIVSSRKAVKRLITSKTLLKSISLQLQQQYSQIKLSQCLQKSTAITRAMNKVCKLPEVSMIMRKMSEEMTKMGIMEEMMNDRFDDMEEVSLSDEEDTVKEVMDEILTDIRKITVSTSKLPEKASDQVSETSDTKEDELKARLDALRESVD